MILSFPDLDTLRLCLTSGSVPAAVSLAPALAGFDAQGRVWLEPSVELSPSACRTLHALGVQVVPASEVALREEVCCWLQLLPVQRSGDAAETTNQTPVLFDVPAGDHLAGLVAEILRLGNDRQSFRWLTDPEKTDKNNRVLLRVVGPPYYSLLRALDTDGRSPAPSAYIERAPRVWVAIAHGHPLVEQITPPPGKLLLMRPPRQWTFYDEGAFRDIYDILEFTLPDAPVHVHDAVLTQRLTVTLRVARGGPIQAAELWVLRDQALAQLDALVRGSSDELLARLAFAVGASEGQQYVVLRVRPSKQAPPVLALEGESYRSYLKLPNLFLPCGTRLHPPLRRDAVRKLLADDLARVTWLAPHADGTFTPEGLPDNAFRPLSDWIDYVLDHDHAALEAWVASARFDFEPFICKDDRAEKPKKAPAREPKQAKKEGWKRWLPGLGKKPQAAPSEEEGPAQDKEDALDEAIATFLQKEDDETNLAGVQPSVLQQRLRTLEERFLSLDGPHNDAERQKLWPELAALNTELGQGADATVCWINALWEKATPLWARGWLRATAKADDRQLAGPYLDRLLVQPESSPEEVRCLAASLVWAVYSGAIAAKGPAAPHAALMARLDRIQHYLERHEKWLPVRAAWLAWVHLVQLSGGDVLALVRARDRLLERLYHEGLRPEVDLPSFLRFSGAGAGRRFRDVRERLLRLRDLAHRWIAKQTLPGGGVDAEPRFTGAYADLTFAFGLARLGEAAACRDLLLQAWQVLEDQDLVHHLLLQAYDYRIQQALKGQAHTGPLPAEQLEALERMETLTRYRVDRLRHHSRILEPQEKIDPYRGAVRRRALLLLGDNLGHELANLPSLTDRAQLADGIHRLLQQTSSRVKQKMERVRVLGVALELAPRLGEEFAQEMLGQVMPTLDGLPEVLAQAGLLETVLTQAELLEKGLFLAAHFDQAEYVQTFVARFQQLLQGGSAVVQAFDSLAGQCFRGLRKFGMRDEIDRLLRQMVDVILEGQSLSALRSRMRDSAGRGAGPATLRLLLHVAAGWYYFGKNDPANQVVSEVRTVLLEKTLSPQEQTKLAATYVTTLGQAPVEMALQRMEELFRKLEGVRYLLTSNTHYVQPLLEVVEAVVLAVASEDFTLGSTVRRWLDDDEFLVRRRIHQDVRTCMSQAGL
jgi:hypothetical protein